MTTASSEPTRFRSWMTNMAICIGMVARVGGVTFNALKPVTCGCARRASNKLCLKRFAHGIRSSLYDHVREGYSDKPDLDMRLVCEETDKVIANVANRKGGLRGDDVREILRHCTTFYSSIDPHDLFSCCYYMCSTHCVLSYCRCCKPSPDL